MKGYFEAFVKRVIETVYDELKSWQDPTSNIQLFNTVFGLLETYPQGVVEVTLNKSLLQADIKLYLAQSDNSESFKVISKKLNFLIDEITSVNWEIGGNTKVFIFKKEDMPHKKSSLLDFNNHANKGMSWVLQALPPFGFIDERDTVYMSIRGLSQEYKKELLAGEALEISL